MAKVQLDGENLASDLFAEVMARLGRIHRWEDSSVDREPTTAEAGVREEAEKMLRFVQGADLGYCSLDVQREARERVYALRRALKGKGV